jgi:two-component system response regulator (stage 0 sporulation protein F)
MAARTSDLEPGAGRLLDSQGRLLLVCEDRESLKVYCTRLKDQGYETDCSASYEDGANSVDQGNFDLVIVSQGSPAFEGRAVLERAIERDRRSRVLVITRALDMNSYLEAMQLGARDYVEKPMEAEGILELVRMSIHPASLKEQLPAGD